VDMTLSNGDNQKLEINENLNFQNFIDCFAGSVVYLSSGLLRKQLITTKMSLQSVAITLCVAF